jgi:hypothetical protein
MTETALDDDKLPAISMVVDDPVATTAVEGRATIIRWMTVLAAEVRRMVFVEAFMILRYGVWYVVWSNDDDCNNSAGGNLRNQCEKKKSFSLPVAQ